MVFSAMDSSLTYEYAIFMTFISIDQVFDCIFPRATTKMLASRMVEKPYVENLTDIFQDYDKEIRYPQALHTKRENVRCKLDWDIKPLSINGKRAI